MQDASGSSHCPRRPRGGAWPEDELLTWRQCFLTLARFGSSPSCQALRGLSPAPLEECAKHFAARVSGDHSWYKHLPLWPSVRFYLFLRRPAAPRDNPHDHVLLNPDSQVAACRGPRPAEWAYGRCWAAVRRQAFPDIPNPTLLEKLCGVEVRATLSPRSSGFAAQWFHKPGWAMLVEQHFPEFPRVCEALRAHAPEVAGHAETLCAEALVERDLRQQLDSMLEAMHMLVELTHGQGGLVGSEPFGRAGRTDSDEDTESDAEVDEAGGLVHRVWRSVEATLPERQAWPQP